MDNELFIDVRTDDEWNDGHLDGALHFELARLEGGSLPDIGKNVPIALYCRHGIRAERAHRILEKNGFANVRNAGGYDDLC